MSKDIFERTEERRRKGKRYAELNRSRLEHEVKTRDRFQQGVFMRNMIKALEIHPWLNSVEDWQRYYEAKIVQAARRKPRKRKNPRGTRYTPGSWYIRLQTRYGSGEILFSGFETDKKGRKIPVFDNTNPKRFKSGLAATRAKNRILNTYKIPTGYHLVSFHESLRRKF